MKGILLDEREARIFSILKRVAERCGTVVRVAGGWVRDKLLGKESEDIDICLEKMTGAQFAMQLVSEIGIPETCIGVIKANPDQSKHLETVTMVIEGLPIDMVNLRSETYAENSRIPEMTMGTPLEDAFRRDLTFNSLFFNIHSGEVEDFTGKGISDLRNGIIRAPLPGIQTFLDDPLRTLRVIRFAVRFGFEIAQETMLAISHQDVQAAFRTKIAPERILKELNGALTMDPCRAIRLLMQSGLGDILIPELAPMKMDQKSKYHDKTVLDFTLNILEHIHRTAPENLPLKLTALFKDVAKPLTAATNKEGGLSFIGHDLEGKRMAQRILRRMRYPKATTDLVSRLVGLHTFPHSPSKWTQLRFFRWLRKIARTTAELDDLLTLREADIRGYAPSARDAAMAEFSELYQRVRGTDVKAILSAVPFVDGEELQRLFGREAGPWIAKVKDQLLDLQFSRKLADKAQALEYLATRELSPSGSLRRRALPPVEAARRKSEAMRKRA